MRFGPGYTSVLRACLLCNCRIQYGSSSPAACRFSGLFLSPLCTFSRPVKPISRCQIVRIRAGIFLPHRRLCYCRIEHRSPRWPACSRNFPLPIVPAFCRLRYTTLNNPVPVIVRSAFRCRPAFIYRRIQYGVTSSSSRCSGPIIIHASVSSSI